MAASRHGGRGILSAIPWSAVALGWPRGNALTWMSTASPEPTQPVNLSSFRFDSFGTEEQLGRSIASKRSTYRPSPSTFRFDHLGQREPAPAGDSRLARRSGAPHLLPLLRIRSPTDTDECR